MYFSVYDGNKKWRDFIQSRRFSLKRSSNVRSGVLFDLDVDESLGGHVFAVHGPGHALVGGELVSADLEI